MTNYLLNLFTEVLDNGYNANAYMEAISYDAINDPFKNNLTGLNKSSRIFEKKSCLMSLKTVNSTCNIYFILDHENIVMHKDFESKSNFIQWWLNFIKDNICDQYDAFICKNIKNYDIIKIPANSKRSYLIGFTNYELTRYLVGSKFNGIPRIVYELLTNYRKYFVNDLEMFYYALFMLDVLSLSMNNKTHGNPNYTWHIYKTIYMNKGTINIPICVKPTDYKNASSNFEHLEDSKDKQLSNNINYFNSVNNLIYNNIYNSYSNLEGNTKKFKDIYEKLIVGDITLNNIDEFKNSLNKFRFITSFNFSDILLNTINENYKTKLKIEINEPQQA